MPSATKLGLGSLVCASLILAARTTRCTPASGPVASDAVALERAFPRLRFERPVFLCGAGDGSNRLFVVEQGGVIRTFPNEPEARSSVFLDLSDQVSRRGNEEGLLGLAFHPDYAENGELFVHYSANDPDMHGTLSRFRVDPDDPNRVEPSSEEVLLRLEQPYRNHNGGMIAFGPDGYLYISFGDGGAADDPHGHGLNPLTWFGSILRIDVDREDEGKAYAVPPENPFVLATDFAAPETWAFGLRNVWRFSFDRETGELWAGDVGQNTTEEIDVIVGGGNYGWNRYEADEVFSEEAWLPEDMHTGPVATYGRDMGISVTGGYVYRGEAFPQLRGSYLFGDYATGNLWRTTQNGEGGYTTELARRTGRSIASFGEDDDGELYVVSFDGGIYRVVSTEDPEDTYADWPQLLSETGLFTSLPEHEVAAHVHPYDVNAPFWSDGATKLRYFVLPEGEALGYRPDGPWDVPVGATIVKSFRKLDRGRERTLETRLIERTEQGWEAATYVWDVNGREARLAADGRQFEIYARPAITTWHAPSASECASCHTDAAGFVLGMTTAQLNREAAGANQIEAWKARGLVRMADDFDAPTAARFVDPHDAAAPLDARARTYLEVNCAMCHRPDGPGNAAIDLRFATPLADTRLVDEPPAQGALGIAEARIVAAGDPARSLLLHRVQTLGDGRMPNVGSNLVDERAVALLADWIDTLETP